MINKTENSKKKIFISGTTGTPKKIVKTWKNMILGAKIAVERFQLNESNYIIGTVPSQHMFGLETTIFWLLFSSASVWSERSIFPEDILMALQININSQAFLVSTPFHLNKILAFNLSWPNNLIKLLSATDTLSKKLAKQIELALNLTVFKIYGSTETASIASRQTTNSSIWKIYKGLELKK